MLLQPTISLSHLHHNQHGVPISSAVSYSISFPSGFRNSTLLPTVRSHRKTVITCSWISQAYSYGTVDYQRRSTVNWKSIYKRISMVDNPEKGCASVLNQWENEGKKLTKWELCRVVKELRKFRRYKPALEVYDWMNNRGERFRISTSDTAIQLDLVAKVNGISSAEDYFIKLPDTLKDKRIYGALLNAYVCAKKRKKAESLMVEMKGRGYASHSLPFNVMMTLYMNLKDYDKVESIISDMTEKNIALDIYSYNIWLSSRGSQGSAEKMEQVFEQMKLDRTTNPNWTTFSTMATMFIKLGQLEKAEDCLKRVESRITGRERIPYHYLISLYGSAGNKEEVQRIWNTYKTVFPYIPNMGYHSVISSFIRLDDIEEAEKIYEEWLSVKTSFDPRIGNFLLGWYVKEGLLEKANTFFNEMLEVGGKPNSSTWEIVAEGHIKERRISDALSCLEKAVSAEGSSFWKPKPVNVSTMLKLCEQEGDTASKEILLGVMRQMGCLEDEATGNEPSIVKGEDEDDDGRAEMLVNQLQASL